MALLEDNSPDPLDSDMTSWLILSVVHFVLVRYDGLKFREVTPYGKTIAEEVLCTGVVVPEIIQIFSMNMPTFVS